MGSSVKVKEGKVGSFTVDMTVYYNSEKYLVVKEGKNWLIISRDDKSLVCEKKNLDPLRDPAVHLREIFDPSSNVTFLVRKWITEKKAKAFFTKLSKRPCPPPMTMILKVIVDSGTDPREIRDLLDKFESYGFGGNISRRFKWTFLWDEPDKLTLGERTALSKEVSRERHQIDEKKKKNGKIVTFFVGRLKELF